VAAAKAALDIAVQSQRRADVRPPRSGVVNSRAVSTGQYVKIGNVLATLVDPSQLNLRFKVSEAESLRARKGQTVTFRVAALGGRSFEARIFHVSDIAEPTTRQVEVVALVKNPGSLKPGFFAEVTLATESHRGARVVPESAVQASEQGFVAYVVAEGKAHLRPVTIGLRTGDGEVEILDGLEAAETVVVEGSDRLADGVPVQVSDSIPAPPSGPSGEGARPEPGR
jgi:multidrug efflux system membrane fusion protein